MTVIGPAGFGLVDSISKLVEFERPERTFAAVGVFVGTDIQGFNNSLFIKAEKRDVDVTLSAT